MTYQLKEALEAAGIGNQPPATTKDKILYHEIFKVTLTKFEVPVLIKVQCDHESQGLKAIANHKLNSIEAASKEEAQLKINEVLCKWTLESVKGPGLLKYWKFYPNKES